MSVVIVGGNERMVCQYEDICKGFGCKAKVLPRKKEHEEKDRGAGSDDPVHQYRFPQMVKLRSRRSKEKIHSGMPLSHKQRCSSREHSEAVLCIRNRSGDTFLLYNLTFFAEMLRKGLQNYKLFNKIAVGFCGKALQ